MTSFLTSILFLNLFLQIFADDIEELPKVLGDSVTMVPDLLQNSRAVNTNKSYTRGFNRWKNWALSCGLGQSDILPSKAFHVAIYLTSLTQTANSASPVINAFYSKQWYHAVFGFESPTSSCLVRNILEAARRKLAKPVEKKKPITIDILSCLYKRLFSIGNIKNQRIVVACLLAYAGFLRSAELLNLKVHDIVFENYYMRIFIESSKTDKYRDGAWIIIARTGTYLCPVRNLEL